MKKLLISRFRMAIMLMLSLSVFACETEEDPLDDEGGNGAIRGVWVRTLGASGDQTTIAIGGIANESENRVYMCEYKGNVGLYKGYIEGNTITWDSMYGLPKSSAKLKGSQLEFYYPSVSGSLPTLYNPGAWSNYCGSLSAGGNNGRGGSSTLGNVIFWCNQDHGCGNISVTLNGSSGTISQYYSSSTPSCGAGGSANFQLAAGTYNYSAKCSKYTWNGSVTVSSGGCFKMRLD